MSEKKKFESGVQKRRLQREKEIRDQELLKKIPKLTGFFKRVDNDAAIASGDAGDGAPLTSGDYGADGAALSSGDAGDGAPPLTSDEGDEWLETTADGNERSSQVRSHLSTSHRQTVVEEDVVEAGDEAGEKAEDVAGDRPEDVAGDRPEDVAEA
ncbi:unnamed protein product [Boreogadus saida]